MKKYSFANLISSYLVLVIFDSFRCTTLIQLTIFAQQQKQQQINNLECVEDWNYYQILDLFPRKEDCDTTHTFNDDNNDSDYNVPSRRKRIYLREQITGKDVKTAYRKQAQIWHPDKIASRKKKGPIDTSNDDALSSRSSKVSVADATARFAKIAEAYEVLSNEDERNNYDKYLLDQEDWKEVEQRHRMNQEPPRQEEETQQTDPFAMFESFFFGSDSDSSPPTDSYGFPIEEERTENDFHDSFRQKEYHQQEQATDGFDFFGFEFEEGQSPGRHSNTEPSRMKESTNIFYDSRYQIKVHRIVHRLEYDEVDKGRIYFKVIGQDFVRDFDHANQENAFMPITEPYFVEDGYLPLQEYHHDHSNAHLRKEEEEQQHHSGHSHHSSITRKILPSSTSKLEANQYLTPHSPYLRSKNGKYYASLTPDCELVVMQNEGQHEDHKLIWTSESYIPPAQYHRHGCFLTLYGAHLAVVLGNVEEPMAVLWNSPSPPPITPGHSEKDTSDELIEYFASLDNDGSLVVYRRGERDEGNSGENVYQNDHDSSHSDRSTWKSYASIFLSNLNFYFVPSPSSPPPQTHIAAAWGSFRKWAFSALISKSEKEPQNTSKSGGARFIRKDECVFATGPAGCLTPGRLFIKCQRNVKRSIGKTIAKLDSKLNNFVEYITDGEEEDDDVLDTLLRVAGKIKTVAGQSGTRIAQRSFHDAEMVVKMVRDTFQEKLNKRKYS